MKRNGVKGINDAIKMKHTTFFASFLVQKRPNFSGNAIIQENSTMLSMGDNNKK